MQHRGFLAWKVSSDQRGHQSEWIYSGSLYWTTAHFHICATDWCIPATTARSTLPASRWHDRGNNLKSIPNKDTLQASRQHSLDSWSGMGWCSEQCDWNDLLPHTCSQHHMVSTTMQSSQLWRSPRPCSLKSVMQAWPLDMFYDIIPAEFEIKHQHKLMKIIFASSS